MEFKMLQWLQKIIDKNSTQAVSPSKPKTVENPIFITKSEIKLTAENQNFLLNNGPEATMEWLLEQLVENLSGSQSADIFAGYYDNRYSKRDIIDQYDDIIKVDENLLMAIVKLGEYYNPQYIDDLYTTLNFHIIPARLVKEIAELTANNAITLKEINNKLYDEFFFFVKTSLSLKEKIMANTDITFEEEEPVDEIEATIRKLLEAERCL